MVALLGPRGGEAVMVRNVNNQNLWALMTSLGRNPKTLWFKATQTGLVPVRYPTN